MKNQYSGSSPCRELKRQCLRKHAFAAISRDPASTAGIVINNIKKCTAGTHTDKREETQSRRAGRQAHTDTAKRDGLAHTDTAKRDGLAHTDTVKRDGLARTDTVKCDRLARTDTDKCDRHTQTRPSATGRQRDTAKRDGLAHTDTAKRDGLAERHDQASRAGWHIPADTQKPNKWWRYDRHKDTVKRDGLAHTDTVKCDRQTRADTGRHGQVWQARTIDGGVPRLPNMFNTGLVVLFVLVFIADLSTYLEGGPAAGGVLGVPSSCTIDKQGLFGPCEGRGACGDPTSLGSAYCAWSPV